MAYMLHFSASKPANLTGLKASMLDLSAIIEAEEQTISIQGNLEGVQQGCVFGWVYEETNPGDPVLVDIYDGERLIGSCYANEYRADLEDAGIADGNCAFNFLLPDDLFDGMSHELTAVAQVSKNLIGSVTSVIPIFATTAIKSLQLGAIRGLINLDAGVDSDSLVVELLVDGKVYLEADSYPSGAPLQHAVLIELPPKLHDDNYHLYSLQVKGKGCTSVPHYARIDSITTRWQYIGNSYSTLNVSALPKVSAYRYKALQSHLRNTPTQENGLNRLEHVQTAHDVVVEGLTNRKKFPKLTLPKVDNPDVSVVLPVHNAFEYTYNCIASLILAYNKLSFEVILVDDESSDRTVNIDDHVENLRVIKNEKNLGFLRTTQSGADAANADYIVLLNNDTEVTSGWLDSLYDTFQRFDNVGIAGSKLIYPDGTLQEAGGLVWGNGQPANIGNGDNPENPIYNYVRHADYVSAASLMISKAAWEKVGGFSEEFIPAYYEDTDLSFKVRDAGFKTLYVPSSVVVHYEGMSNGCDLDSGYKRYQTVNAPLFRKKWRHAYRHNGEYRKNIEMEVDRNKDFRVLMVDYATPKPDQDAGSYAALQEMRLLQELGCKITFVPNNVAHMGKYTTALQNEGIECLYAPFHRNVGEVLRDRGMEFDLVYITRFSVAEEIIQYVRKYSKAKIALNNADLHFLREMRAAAHGSDEEVAYAMDTRRRELDVMNQVDAILSYNDTEHSIISSHTFEGDNIFKCPWVLTEKPLRVPFSERKGIAFLGGFNHMPNREGVNFFVEKVMPLIREKAPEINFHVFGSNVPDEIEDLASDDIHIEGYVESLDTLFDQCRVFVAPLLSGAGIKGKVLESVSYQVPCVLSPIAAESTGLVHDLNSKIAESPQEWADAIISLYNDESEWTRLSQKALELVQERYSVAHGLNAMSEMMSYLELDPAANRELNYKAA